MIRQRHVPLAQPVALVPLPRTVMGLMERRHAHASLPATVEDLVSDVQRVSATAGGVPATVENGTDRPRLVLYLDGYRTGCFPSSRGGAYSIGFVEPMRFRDHRRLIDGFLRVEPPAWHLHPVLKGVPDGYGSGWPRIEQSWERLLAEQQPAPARNVEHDRYLDLLDELIRATRQIELGKDRSPYQVQYRAVEPVGERRYSARGIYAFALAGPARFGLGTHVHVDQHTGLRGRILALEDGRAVVKFDEVPDRDGIPRQGALRESTKQVTYRAHEEAVRTLREGRSANRGLLRVLVDGRFQTFRPDQRTPGPEVLKRQQRDAFAAALAVPDLMLIWGPPGTGKTLTISEIVAARVARGERIMVTAHSNRAVDNLLERLPSEIRSLRAGKHEQHMSPHARSLTMEAQATQMQKRISERTEATASRLAAFAGGGAEVRRWVSHLGAQLEPVRELAARIQALEDARAGIVERLSASMRERLEVVRAAPAAARAAVERWSRSTGRRSRLVAHCSARAGRPVLGLGYRALARLAERALRAGQARLAEARRELDAAEVEQRRTEEELRRVLTADAGFLRCDRELASAGRDLEARWDEVRRAREAIREAMAGVDSPPDVDRAGVDVLRGLIDWCEAGVALMRERADLLDEWRRTLRDRTEQLYPELVLHADVVAATCIGAATTKELESVEFDLAIMDEAGQVSLPDALVPLVRAKSGVLVGDHKQLPPFLDDDVGKWLRGEQAATIVAAAGGQVRDLLARSIFEQLHARANPPNAIRLEAQWRMPRAIADFVSRHFYDGRLDTVPNEPHRDVLFAKALALVDTSDDKRAEEYAPDTEPWREGGYKNEAEAEIIVELIELYRSLQVDCAAILPYRAQADLIVERLAAATGDREAARLDVGVVDSFQGGERDVIVYGFTRSNDRRDIGHLRELRRLNVAMTRARRQLVLVGDAGMLRHARNDQFRALFRALHEYAAGPHGEIHQAATLREAVARRRRGHAG